MACVHQTEEGTILVIHAQPSASRTEWAGRYGESLKVRIAAPPTDGVANEELRRFLAERFGLPLRSVEFVSGEGSRHKRILLKGASAERVCGLVDDAAPVKRLQ